MTCSVVAVSLLVITACTSDDEPASWEMAAESSCAGWGGLTCAGGIGICIGNVLLGSFCEVEGTGSGIPMSRGGIVGIGGGSDGGEGGGSDAGTGGGPDAGIGGGPDAGTGGGADAETERGGNLGTGGGFDAGAGGGTKSIVLLSRAHVSATYLQLYPKWHSRKCQ